MECTCANHWAKYPSLNVYFKESVENILIWRPLTIVHWNVAQKGFMPDLMILYQHLEILNSFWTRAHTLVLDLSTYGFGPVYFLPQNKKNRKKERKKTHNATGFSSVLITGQNNILAECSWIRNMSYICLYLSLNRMRIKEWNIHIFWKWNSMELFDKILEISYRDTVLLLSYLFGFRIRVPHPDWLIYWGQVLLEDPQDAFASE